MVDNSRVAAVKAADAWGASSESRTEIGAATSQEMENGGMPVEKPVKSMENLGKESADLLERRRNLAKCSGICLNSAGDLVKREEELPKSAKQLGQSVGRLDQVARKLGQVSQHLPQADR